MSIYAVNGKAPIAAWIPSRDDAGRNTTTVSDFAGSNPLVLTSSSWSTDGGGAINFTGSVSGASANNFSFLRRATLSFWANAATFSSVTRVLFELTPNYNNNQGFLILNDANTLQATNSFSYNGGTHTPPLANQWHHFVYNLHRNNSASIGVSGFVNGTAITFSQTFSTVLNNDYTAGKVFVGARNNTSFRFVGLMDDIRIFNVALNADDSSALVAAQRGGITNPPTIFPRRRRSRSGGGVL
jgi:hypothetical protein